MSAFADLLPAGAVAATTAGDEPPAPLLPEEATLVGRAVDKRRREVAHGRQCARRALAQLGAAAGPILAGPRGEPLWPAGYVGSITHCHGLVAAAVARDDELVGVGIDAEPAEDLRPALLRKVCTADEVLWTARRDGSLPWGKLIFCAKEALYKCVYPTAGVLLGFHDVALTIGEDGSFVGESRVCDVRAVRGRWAITRSHVLTVASWPR